MASTGTTIDGRAIARDVRERIAPAFAAAPHRPVLRIVHRSDIAAARSYLRIKRETGAALGVDVRQHALPARADTPTAAAAVTDAARESDGVLVQLPLPATLDTNAVCDAIPADVDVDVLSSASRARYEAGELPILPPVVGAVAEVCRRYGVVLSGVNVAVLGRGALVGAPATTWFRRQGANVTVLDRETPDIASHTARADIVLVGTGAADTLTPASVKRGAVLLDAGTSDVDGGVKPAIDPACIQYVSLLTPVPGGLGPITVACLFENLAVLGGWQDVRP